MMTMRDDFCVFILTNGRPDKVYTAATLKRQGYTGKCYIVIDDEDKTAADYRVRFGASVLEFSKAKIAKTFDEGDNFNDRRAIIYARNACFELAEQVGCKYFMQLDDDYTRFNYKFNAKSQYGEWPIKSLDKTISKLVEYFETIPALSIAIAQGGDFIGGKESPHARSIRTKRKAMNTFICSTEKPFSFFGRVNEDVNTYTNLQRRGGMFLTIMQLEIKQKQTQSNSGGMTEMYLDSGTYVKSFYSVMYSPSCVKIKEMRSKNARLHHSVTWRHTTPMILDERHKR